MANQSTIKQAHEQGYLELSKWADLMIHRIKMNFETQRIWPLGKDGGGPYEDYHILNKRRGKYGSTGEAFLDRNLYAKVLAGAGGNTVAVDFFFRQYLFFVDWGVGRGMGKEEVPDRGVPRMKKRYAVWNGRGDRQRRPVVVGAIRGSRFFLGNILEKYWGKEAELAILYGLGYDKGKDEFVAFEGVE